MIKSNPITTGWVTHKLENNNTKVLALYLPVMEREMDDLLLHFF